MVGSKMLSVLRMSKHVELPAGLLEVGQSWFTFTQIEKVVIPASVKTIRRWAFAECDKLQSVVFA